MFDFFRAGLELAKIRRRLFRNYKAARWAVFAVAGTMMIGMLVFILPPIARLSKELLFGPIGIFSVVLPSGQEIKSSNGRTNVLLLGTGGASHDGPNLTDTIIVASIKTKLEGKQKADDFPIILISIPRDIYLDSLEGKINTAYSLGEERAKGAGIILAKGAVAEISGLPIHYAARVDFSAFEQIVDVLGGVDIAVERAFEDPQYPISGKENETCGLTPEQVEQSKNALEPEKVFTCRFEHLRFEAGISHMNGNLALKFARSRHAEGADEGTDFARSKRQQLVISAVKAKAFSTDLLLRPDRIEQIYQLVKKNIDTDVDSSQVNNLVKLALNYRQSKFSNVILDMKLLDNPPIDERGWILLPKDGGWSQIHNFIKQQIGN